MTRDEAIAELRSRGINASARDWGMGATIRILLGERQIHETPHGNIEAYPAGIYVCPDGEGWMLLDVACEPMAHFADLAAAVVGAREYVDTWERAKRP
jgi:hypothetical protein